MGKLLTFIERTKLERDVVQNVRRPELRYADEHFFRIGRQMEAKLVEQQYERLVGQDRKLVLVPGHNRDGLLFHCVGNENIF